MSRGTLLVAAPLDLRPGERRGVRRFGPLILAVTDAALIYVAFVLAYWVRYDLQLGPQIHSRIAFSAYEPLVLLLLAVIMPALFLKGAYRMRLSTEVVDEAVIIFSTVTIAIATIVVITAML